VAAARSGSNNAGYYGKLGAGRRFTQRIQSVKAAARAGPLDDDCSLLVVYFPVSVA
jgi:hypothetical protein